MRNKSDMTADRREWLAGMLRWGSLGVLGALSTVLVLRRRSGSRETRCERRKPCDRCLVFHGCHLPPAMKSKRRQRRS